MEPIKNLRQILKEEAATRKLLTTPRILIVEDSEAAQQLIRRSVGAEVDDLNISTAPDGYVAMQMLESHHPPLSLIHI